MPSTSTIRALINGGRAGDLAWRLIETGEVGAFSVFPSYSDQDVEAVVDGVRFVKRWRVREVSICRAGKNAAATFEIFA